VDLQPAVLLGDVGEEAPFEGGVAGVPPFRVINSSSLAMSSACPRLCSTNVRATKVERWVKKLMI
jgi:hypothetical protein